MAMGGSYVIANEDWTFSSQLNEVPMKGTLSAADQTRCTKAFEVLGTEQFGCGDAGTVLDAYGRRYPDGGGDSEELCR